MISSIGKSPTKAPHSVVILAMESLWSIVKFLTPSPENSIPKFNTSSLLKYPQRAIIKSFPVTPLLNELIKFTFAIGGTCHHVLPVAQIAAASVLTIGV